MNDTKGRAPHGARGLKLADRLPYNLDHGRAPHGARGLKHEVCIRLIDYVRSRPARGAWIETDYFFLFLLFLQSRPARGAWIETA